jgi:hypothetical protein
MTTLRAVLVTTYPTINALAIARRRRAELIAKADSCEHGGVHGVGPPGSCGEHPTNTWPPVLVKVHRGCSLYPYKAAA